MKKVSVQQTSTAGHSISLNDKRSNMPLRSISTEFSHTLHILNNLGETWRTTLICDSYCSSTYFGILCNQFWVSGTGIIASILKFSIHYIISMSLCQIRGEKWKVHFFLTLSLGPYFNCCVIYKNRTFSNIFFIYGSSGSVLLMLPDTSQYKTLFSVYNFAKG